MTYYFNPHRVAAVGRTLYLQITMYLNTTTTCLSKTDKSIDIMLRYDIIWPIEKRQTRREYRRSRLPRCGGGVIIIIDYYFCYGRLCTVYIIIVSTYITYFCSGAGYSEKNCCTWSTLRPLVGPIVIANDRLRSSTPCKRLSSISSADDRSETGWIFGNCSAGARIDYFTRIKNKANNNLP